MKKLDMKKAGYEKPGYECTCFHPADAAQRPSPVIRKRRQHGDVTRVVFSYPEATWLVNRAAHMASRESGT